MYHYLYRVTNLVNSKVYVGKHSTTDLNDGYMGSGTLLRRAFKKYGIDSFKLEILEFCASAEATSELERKIVNEDFVKSNNTYNVRVGGKGGFLTKDASQRGGSTSLRNRWLDPVWRIKHIQSIAERNKRLHAEGVLKPPNITGMKHTEETKQKIGLANSIHQRGKNNSQFGTAWISNAMTHEIKKISKIDLDQYLSQGWHRG